ncbi:MAG: hypothetical protein WEB37_03170 [Bacteroidota bacterium]
MVVRRIEKAEAEDQRQRLIAISLFSIVVLGISYLVYDYTQIINRATLPENLEAVDPIVAQWRTEGLVDSFDAARSNVVVNESFWERRERSEKIGIMTQLARYCSEKNPDRKWRITVVGKRSSRVLAEIGDSGLRLQ